MIFMAQQFWVNNYFIDVSRNQIQHQQQATQLPPKALKVLEVLASRAGEVVSHDELMDIVWENSVVGPNTLQRAIAQLRKALGDDSKQQAFIKTHAKKGYSLDANVRWENSCTETTDAPSDNVFQATEYPSIRKPYWLVASAIFVIMVAVLIFLRDNPTLYDQVTPITASDAQEYNASYSPDGKYLVFNRFEGQCVSHLWAKDLTNNQEVRLSEDPGHYSSLSWSADGSQIAFVMQSDCEAEVDLTQQCWQLQTLDFARAWNGDVSNTVRFDCAKIQTSHPTWLNDGRIALLQYPTSGNDGPKVVIHDARTGSVSDVPLAHGGEIYALVYSRARDVLASIAKEANNQHVLRTFRIDGEILSEATIQRLPHHSVYHSLSISFAPDGESFLTSPGGQIHALSLDGELSLLHSDSIDGLSNPVYHPNQTKITATQGTKDFDIGVLNIDENDAVISVMARSTETDINAQHQPNGDLIAFVSYRTGNSQLWLIEGERIYQLTQFDDGMTGLLYSWSPDGQQLLVNVNHQLALVELDGSYRFIESPIAVNYIVPWTQPTKLLAIATQSKNDQLFSIDLATGETTDTGISDVLWATYTEQQDILYSDNQKDFFLSSGDSTIALTTLNNKLYGKRVLFTNNELYGLDIRHQLWRYELPNGALEYLTTTNKDVMNVSSLQDGQMLGSQFIGGRRELVELTEQR